MSLMVQVHMIARKEQMTSLIAINTFLKEFDSTLTLIPGVIGEIPKFLKAWKHTEQQIGPEWFPYAKVTRHPEAAKVSPSEFAKLTSATLYHASETSSIVKSYTRGCAIPGGLPETRLRAAIE